jgi:hypothetical protein
MKRVRQLLMMSLLILGSFTAAHAASYYVDSTSGADSNSGTSSAAPWQSLSKVNSTTFQAGDTINFKRDSVWTGTLQVGYSGTSASPITYQAYGTGAAPQINNPGVNFGHDIDVSGDYNVIRDFLLTDAHEAGVFIAATGDHNLIQNNEMTAAGTGVTVLGQYNLITQNYVHDLNIIVNTPGGTDDYGAVCFWLNAGNNEVSYNQGINCKAPSYDFGYDGGFVEVFNQGDNSYIHHNYAKNTVGFIELGARGGGSAQNVTIAYNVMVNVDAAGCFNTGINAITVTNFKFENNTFVNTANDGLGDQVFTCTDDYSALQVRNNIFYSNLQIANNGNFTHTNNLYYIVNQISGSGVGYTLGRHEKTGNPLFVNVRAGDFHLQAGSPAIDAGIDLGYTKDFGDNTIPVGIAPDMGAYEYRGINDLVTFEPLQSTFTFTPDPTGCPRGFVGTFNFEARLTNSSERSLSDLVVTVTALTNGNLLQNADGGPAGVGARLTVPQEDEFADGILSPDEFVDVPLIICLTEQQPFRFVVDVLEEAE